MSERQVLEKAARFFEVDLEDDPKTRLRIEALRAASRIAAGACQIPSGAIEQRFIVNGEKVSIDQWTLFNAGQFLRWLETGK